MALAVAEIACQLPSDQGVALGRWDCREIALELVQRKVVPAISAETVRRILRHARLRPWRWHYWLTPRVPRDAAFAECVQALLDLYLRPLAADEAVLCVDEKTSLQPRRRLAATQPARPGQPLRIEHEYERGGALNLFAAFDSRSGKVFGMTAPRKRAVEFLAFMEQLEHELPETWTTVHVVLDNLRVHKGRAAQAWLAAHPRFVFHFPPVHCSWLNQVEQWFGIIQRKLLSLANYPDRNALAEAVHAFIARWNDRAHPFAWSTCSVDRVLASCQPTPPRAA